MIHFPVGMAKRNIRIIGVIPGMAYLEPLIQEFARGGPGLITALDDERLPYAARCIPENAPLEAVPLGELVGRFMASCNVHAPAVAQKAQIEAAIAEACSQLSEDSPFYDTRAMGGLHRAIASTLAELRHWGLDAAEMGALASKTNPQLSTKLASLEEIATRVTETLSQLGRGTGTDRLEECLLLKPADGLSLGRLFVVAGSEYSPRNVEWIKWAADQGAKVTVIVDRTGAPVERLFAGAARIAGDIGADLQSEGTATGLAKALFGSGAPVEPDIEIRFETAADVLAEVEWALRSCHEDISNGVDPQRIAIYSRDLQTYAPLIEFCAKRFNLPVKLSRRAPLSTNAFARLLLHCLSFSASNDVRTLIPILKSSYLGLTPADQQSLSGALRASYATRHRQWSALEDWAAQKESQYPWLVRLLLWRRDAVAEPASLAAWVGKLVRLVEELEWNESAVAGAEIARSRDARAQSALQRALFNVASIRAVRSHEPLSLAGFAALCAQIWEEADTSLPSDEHGIEVTHSAARLGKVECLYVLGMLEGVFPRRRSEDSILSDDDRATISSLRPYRPPLPNSVDRARAERDEFYRVCAAPSAKLVLSYPEAGDDRDNVPAFYLVEVQRAVTKQIARIHHPRAHLVPEMPSTPSDEKLSEALRGEREGPLPNELLTEEAQELVRMPKEGPFTPRELREVLECPFRHMSARRLNLHVLRERSRWSRLRYLPKDVALWTQPDADHARKALIAALDSELDQLYAEASPYELALLEKGGRRMIAEWVDREFEARTLWPKDGGSVIPNLGFGDGPLRERLDFQSMGTVRLEGKVDAVATMGNYNVAYMTERRRPQEEPQTHELSALDKLEMGLVLLAMHEKGKATALESETMRGERILYVLPRLSYPALGSRRQSGLKLIELGEPRDFFDEVRSNLRDALFRVQRPVVEATEGEHCHWCDFGELCRRHVDFGEGRENFGDDADLD
jgi:hypothetical protein